MPKETSKRVLLFTLLFCFLGIVACLIALYLEKAGAVAMAGIFATPAATVIAYYFWKAKNENVLKIVKSGDATMREAIALSKTSAITNTTTPTFSVSDDEDELVG